MPIFDQGYQHWTGPLSGHAWRWLTIARHGVRVQAGNRWVRMCLILAMLPAVVLSLVLILWGLFEQQSPMVMPIMAFFRIPGLDQMMNAPVDYRTAVWSMSYYYFFMVEIFLAMILVVLIGPGLISQDLRFNAIPLYYSRPLRRIDYFLGKLGVIGACLAGVVVLPALLAFAMGLLFSLDFAVIKDEWRTVGGSVLYGVIILLSAGTLMLALSSLSRNSRYVAMMWVGLWIISNVLAGVLFANIREPECKLVSYTYNLQRMGDVIFDTETATQKFKTLVPKRDRMPESPVDADPPWYWSAAILAGLFGLSTCILSTRVKSLDRLK
jgi:ABC-2 type transport system permease protein